MKTRRPQSGTAIARARTLRDDAGRSYRKGAGILASHRTRAGAEAVARAGDDMERAAASLARALLRRLGLGSALGGADVVGILLNAEEHILPRPIAVQLSDIQLALVSIHMLRRYCQLLLEFRDAEADLMDSGDRAIRGLEALMSLEPRSAQWALLRKVLARSLEYPIGKVSMKRR